MNTISSEILLNLTNNSTNFNIYLMILLLFVVVLHVKVFLWLIAKEYLTTQGTACTNNT